METESQQLSAVYIPRVLNCSSACLSAFVLGVPEEHLIENQQSAQLVAILADDWRNPQGTRRGKTWHRRGKVCPQC